MAHIYSKSNGNISNKGNTLITTLVMYMKHMYGQSFPANFGLSSSVSYDNWLTPPNNLVGISPSLMIYGRHKHGILSSVLFPRIIVVAEL